MPLLRYVGAYCLKMILKKCIRGNEQFKEWLKNGEEFAITVVTYLFSEKCLPIKTELAEAMCDLIKQFNTDVLDNYVNKGHYITGSLLTLKEICKQIKIYKIELSKL